MNIDEKKPATALTTHETEAELEVFRQQWRDEVLARNQKPDLRTRINERKIQRAQGAPPPAHATAGPSTARRKDNYNEEIEPKAYHDLPDKEEQLKLGVEEQGHDRSSIFKEPSNALEHYERAVEKETQGNLGESIRHYRKAFKLDDGVHEAYQRKHFPASAFPKPKPTNTNPSNAAATVPGTDHHSLRSGDALPTTLKQLINDFSSLRIEAMEAETSLSSPPKCPIAELPDEILAHILLDVAISDVASFARLAQVCKRLAYIVMTEESIWRRIATGPEFGFAAMHYDYAVDLSGLPLLSTNENDSYDLAQYSPHSASASAAPTPPSLTSQLTTTLLHTTYASSYLTLFRLRPRIRFNGCYISTVNYTRAGATASNTLTWGAPVHVVTYFRYLRFFRDGGCISLLTTAEPQDVVHYLTKENLSAKNHGAHLPSAVMRDALRGRWRLSGPASTSRSSADGSAADVAAAEPEGSLHVETLGVTPKYTYKLLLALAHAGKGARNNKLAWKGFWSYNRLTEDWGEFGLRNDRAFYWSRVRSYGVLGE